MQVADAAPVGTQLELAGELGGVAEPQIESLPRQGVDVVRRIAGQDPTPLRILSAPLAGLR